MPIFKETTFFGKWRVESEVKKRSNHALDSAIGASVQRRFVVGNENIGFVDHRRGYGLMREEQHIAVVAKDEINKSNLRKTRMGGKIETVFRWKPEKNK